MLHDAILVGGTFATESIAAIDRLVARLWRALVEGYGTRASLYPFRGAAARDRTKNNYRSTRDEWFRIQGSFLG
jgi:hypothetical protein